MELESFRNDKELPAMDSVGVPPPVENSCDSTVDRGSDSMVPREPAVEKVLLVAHILYISFMEASPLFKEG